MEHFQSFCRLCLTRNGSLLYIFDGEYNILQQLSVCLSINVTVEDKLPKHICSECAANLQKFHTFYTDVKRCERLLFACLGNTSSNLVTNKKDLKTTEVKINKSSYSTLPIESSIISEFSDNSNAFDSALLSNNSADLSTLEYLDESISESDITQALLQNGAKFTKIANLVQKDTSDSYEIHMEIDVLDSDFEIVNEILARESQNNASNGNYSCMSCKSIFNDFELLTKHMETCDALKNTCVECNAVFNTKIKLQKHLQTHKKSDSHQCKYCSLMFNTKSDLQDHIHKTHSDISYGTNCIFRCKKCSFIFHSKSELYLHIKAHLKSKVKRQNGNFECANCDKKFFNQTNLLKHRKMAHENDFNNGSTCVYRCKICSTMFTNKNKLYSHIKIHTDALGDDNPKLCDTCGKSFNTAKALSRHVQMHKGKYLSCDICSKQFSNSVLLKEHTNSHNTGIQICELCGVTLTNEYDLHNHKMKNHCMGVIK